MKTLALVQGDLSPAPGGYKVLEGAAKIHQDLSLALRELYGGDQLHPKWGSILQSYVGTPIDPEVRGKLLTEINRVLSNYITVQNARISQDSINGTSSRMSTDDVVKAIVATSAQSAYDSIVINVIVETISRQKINIDQVIS